MNSNKGESFEEQGNDENIREVHGKLDTNEKRKRRNQMERGRSLSKSEPDSEDHEDSCISNAVSFLSFSQSTSSEEEDLNIKNTPRTTRDRHKRNQKGSEIKADTPLRSKAQEVTYNIEDITSHNSKTHEAVLTIKKNEKAVPPNSKIKKHAMTPCSKTEDQALFVTKSSSNVSSDTKSIRDSPSNSRTRRIVSYSNHTKMEVPSTSKIQPMLHNTNIGKDPPSKTKIGGDIQSDRKTNRDASSRKKTNKKSSCSAKSDTETPSSSKNERYVLTETKAIVETKSNSSSGNSTKKTGRKSPSMTKIEEDAPSNIMTGSIDLLHSKPKKETQLSRKLEKGSLSTAKTEKHFVTQQAVIGKNSRNPSLVKLHDSPKHKIQADTEVKKSEDPKMEKRQMNANLSRSNEEKSKGKNKIGSQDRKTANKFSKEETNFSPHVERNLGDDRKKKRTSLLESSSTEEPSSVKVYKQLTQPVHGMNSTSSGSEETAGSRKLGNYEKEDGSSDCIEQEGNGEVESIKSKISSEHKQADSQKCESSSEISDNDEHNKDDDTGKSERVEEEDGGETEEENEEKVEEEEEDDVEVKKEIKEEVIEKEEPDEDSESNEVEKTDTEEDEDDDNEKNDKDGTSVKKQESGSEESVTDEEVNKTSSSDDESDEKSDSEKEADNTKPGEFAFPIRKALPSGVKAKLLNIKLGPASGDWASNPQCGNGFIGLLTHPKHQNSDPEQFEEVQSGSNMGRGQRPSPHLKDKTEVKPKTATKLNHVFTAQTQIITTLRRKQREAREKVLSRVTLDQILTSEYDKHDTTKCTEEGIRIEDQQSTHSTVSSRSSYIKKPLNVQIENVKQEETQMMQYENGQRPSKNNDKDKAKNLEDSVAKEVAPDAQKDAKAACSISAFRKVTGWLRRVPPKKNSLKERLASVARAIGITDWLFRTFRKRKKHRQCELKRRTAMRLLSTSRLVNQFSQVPAGKLSANEDQNGKGIEMKSGNQMISETEKSLEISQFPAPKLAGPSEMEETAGTVDAKYAIVFPRIHHLAKTIKVTPATHRSTNRTDQRVVVSLQPATSSRNSDVSIKENMKDIQPENRVSSLSSQYRSFPLMKPRTVLNPFPKECSENSSATFPRPRHINDVSESRDSMETEENAINGEPQSESTFGDTATDEEEIDQQGPSYEATTHVHWAQSVSHRGDPASWLSSETLLPRLTIENLSKWSMHQAVPYAKPVQSIQSPGDRWETEDLTEDILQMSMNKKQVKAGEEYPEIEEVSDLSFLQHLFSIVEEAYTLSQTTEFIPNILLSGHSGSGKTKAIKLISWYLTHRRQGGRVGQLTDYLFALESFGNAKTTLNDNSTRFGQILQVFFQRGVLVGSSVSQYLLEKSRVVFQAVGERSFHVFYELLEGLPEHEKQGLYLQEPETYYYLNQGRACDLPGKNEKNDFLQLGKYLRAIGLSDNQLISMWAILSAILQLGNICFTSSERDSFGSAAAFSVTEIRIVANLLQISPEGLQKAITQRVTVTSYDQVLSPLSVEASIDARDAISQSLYSLLFDWLLEKGNYWLCARETDSSLYVIDICGFENLGVNSLEQLCRNFGNELVQYHSTQRLISQEQAEYVREGLCWSTLSTDGAVSCLELLTGRPHGILHILEEQSELAQATDHTFLQKCHYHHGDSSCYLKPKLPLPVFTLQHYAGPVTYQVHNFLSKNRNRLPPLARDVLAQSRLKVQWVEEQLFPLDVSTLTVLKYYIEDNLWKGFFRPSTSLAGADIFFVGKKDGGLRPCIDYQDLNGITIKNHFRLPLILEFMDRLKVQKNKGKCPDPTLSERFQISMQDLTSRLERSRTLFIRCISPNTKKLPGVFDVEFVTSQLQNSGILEVVQLMKEGYPVRIPLKEFVRRYAHLAGRGISFSDERESCAAVLTKTLGDPSPFYQIGFSKVFLKERGREMLQSRWEELQSFAALTLQKNLRGFLNRKNFQAYRHKITVIQAHVRGHQARRRYKRLKSTRVQFGAALLISRLPSIYRRKHQLQERPLGSTGQEPLPSMDLTLLDVPADLASVLNGAQSQSYSQGAQITEVTPPQVVVQSNLSLPHDINNYPFSIFIRSYFKDSSLPPLGKPLKDPLTRVSRDDHAAALELYKLALRFVGNSAMPTMQQRLLGNYLAERCLRQSSLTDEVLCQVASLTVQNANEEQCQRAWLLLASLLSCLIPSPTLERPLLKYVSDQGFEGYKAICQHKILRAGCNGQNSHEVFRSHAPSMLEWTANERRGKMVVDLHTNNEEKFSTEVDSWATGEQIAGWLLQYRGVGETPRGWSVSILNGDEWIDLAGNEFMLDVISEVEDGVPPPLFNTDYPFGDDKDIPEPPMDFAPQLPAFPPPPGLPPGPPPGLSPALPLGLPPAPPLPPPLNLALLERETSIPPAPPLQAPSLPPGGQNGNGILDNLVDQLFNPILTSPSDLNKSDNLNWRMKGGGGIGPTRQGPFNPSGYSGVGSMPSYGMPVMNGMMPGMGAMPMMPSMQAMMPGQAMMPQPMMPQHMMPQHMMPQVMPQSMPMMPSVDPTQLAAQQQAFINQQALLLAQQMTLQATMLSQQQQPQHHRDPPQRTIEHSPPPAPKPAPKVLPKSASLSAPATPSALAPPLAHNPPVAPSAPTPQPPTPPQLKPEIRNSPISTEVYWETEDETDYSQQKQTFLQKRQFFQKMASQEIKVKSLKPPSKILLPSTGSKNEEREESEEREEEPPEPAEPEPKPDIPKAPPVLPTPAPKKPQPKDKDPVRGPVVQRPPVPKPSREIRDIIMMYQSRPEPELKPFQPVRRPANSFLKKKDPKQEALERLQMSGGPPPEPPKPPPVRREKSNSIREKQKPLLDVFPPSFIPPPPDIEAPKETGTENKAGRTLDGDHQVKSSLTKHTASVFFSYSDVNWRLYVRKELFYSKEKFTQPYYLNLLCEQIIRDTYSESVLRLTREERRKMRDLLSEYRVGSDANSISEESIKKRIVIAARDNWENYFSRLFPVSLEDNTDSLMLGVSHRGIRLVKDVSATGIQQRHLKTLCSYSFADVMSMEMPGSYTIKFCLRNEDLLVHSEKAQSLKALVDIFVQELVKDSNHVIALRSYITDDKSLLQFKKGDIIKVLPMDGLQNGWQFGSIGGRSGLFPSHMVQPAATPDYYTVVDGNVETNNQPKLLRMSTKRSISKESSRTSTISLPTKSPSPTPVDVATYTMVEFALKYFREPQTMMGWKGMAAERKKPIELVQHTKVPIQESLILFNDRELNEQATNNFMTLMRFMGDQQYREQDDVACLYEILQLCKEHQTLTDEVYCQVLKQITENSKQESCNRGWIVLSLLTGYFIPSPTLLPYVTKYLQDSVGTYQEISRNCQEHLRHTVLYHGRRHLPPRRELEALLNDRVSRRITVVLPGGAEYSTLIRTFTVAANIVPEICEQLMVSDLHEVEEFALFANKSQGEVVRPLRSGEYIHDFLLLDNTVSLEFRRVTWKATLRGRSDLFVQVHFSQMHQDYMQGNYLLLSSVDKLETQTGTVAAILHRLKGLSAPPNKQDLLVYIPKSVHNRLNLQATHQYLMQELRETENMIPQQLQLRFMETVSAFPLFEYNVFQVKRISEQSLITPCFVAVNHKECLVLEMNSQQPHLAINLKDIKSMRTMRPLDSNTLPGVELYYGTPANPHTLWMELQEATNCSAVEIRLNGI
ncbi:myosin XVB [Pelodytes ibericus]